MLERDLEATCRKLARARGALLWKWVSPGNRGVPDRILIGTDRRVAFVEFKQPGKKPTPLQQVKIEELRSRGQVVAVIDNVQDFERLLAWALDEETT